MTNKQVRPNLEFYFFFMHFTLFYERSVDSSATFFTLAAVCGPLLKIMFPIEHFIKRLKLTVGCYFS